MIQQQRGSLSQSTCMFGNLSFGQGSWLKESCTIAIPFCKTWALLQVGTARTSHQGKKQIQQSAAQNEQRSSFLMGKESVQSCYGPRLLIASTQDENLAGRFSIDFALILMRFGRLISARFPLDFCETTDTVTTFGSPPQQ